MSPSARNITAWILQALLGLVFIGFGGYGLLHAPENMKTVSGMDLPMWFAYLIGGAGLLGGIGRLVPPTVRPAARGLLIIMIGAVVLPATKIPGGLANSIPAIVFLLPWLAVLWLRRPIAPVPER